MKKWDFILNDIVAKIAGDRDAGVVGNQIVPIIGQEVYYVDTDNGKISVQEYIVDELLKKDGDLANIAPHLITEENKKLCLQEGIKGLHSLSKLFEEAGLTLANKLYLLLKNGGQHKIKLNETVRSFLKKGNFPLILTTNYFRVLEDIITYDDDENYSIISYQIEKNRNQDIKLSPVDMFLYEPAIFHIFGIVRPASKCVLTEDDFLSYLHALQDTNTYPQNLRQYLRDKYLLTIGCDIPDWTFRLLLYSLKEKDGRISITGGNKDSFIGGSINNQLDKDFVSFLGRIKYYSDDNIYDFLEDVTKYLPDQDKPSIFLSICSEDYNDIGDVLSSKLRQRFKVWFCKEKLSGNGGEAYWSKIQQGLEQCRYFMPVITPTACNKLLRADDITGPKPDKEGGIITEWKYANDVWKRKYAPLSKKYCIPYRLGVSIEDLKNGILDKFQGELFSLFFNESGNQHIDNVSPQDFSANDIAI